jgi:sugar/nucleoside kinase (ribokinase family)
MPVERHHVTRPVDVLVLGDANPDLILRGGDLESVSNQREALAETATLTVGGSGAIFACAAARLGLSVAFVGAVGNDVFGRFMREELASRGVDVSGLVVRDGRASGVSVVLSRPADRGTYTAAGTIGDLSDADIDRDLLASARHVHVASYYLQRSLRPGLPQLLRGARSAGATTSLDPNWDPAESWDGGLRALLEDIDVFLPNAAEITRIVDRSDVEEAAEAISHGDNAIAVKLGGDGALVLRGSWARRLPAPRVEVVDTTGAGDAFDAGFVFGVVREWSLERCLALATSCGALSCRGIGGVAALPTLQEALALAE